MLTWQKLSHPTAYSGGMYCPTPTKRGYATLAAAAAAADKVSFDAVPYMCECGLRHLTNTKVGHRSKASKEASRSARRSA